MKIHLVELRKSAFDAMMNLYRAADPPLHDLVDDPEVAEVILFVGGWGDHGERLRNDPLPKRYPEKCFVYFDDDGFEPLLPGIYTNAERPGWIDLRRTMSYMFIDALNPFVEPTGEPVHKKYLFSFAGGSTSLLRKKLYRIQFDRDDVLIRNTSDYYHWDPSQAGREQRQKEYAEVIASSRFGLCPRGASSGGLRLFEVMQMGVAPVLISDSFELPEGPDWDRFLIRIPERRIKELPEILEPFANESAERGRLARQAWELWFAPPVMFNRIVEACVRIHERKRIPERWIHPFWGYMLWRRRVAGSSRALLKRIVLWVFRVLGLRFIYEMNER